ncbi:hypothetical protein [Thermospira aquatica]|uniref:DUF2207 domain-containing protein n=1 Tax=Thermospira aquatica TaxID=2828656 RepID=A0AAX3BBI9_9SPIR|nr:hypothetical protein [Thermospira aquatica]URA09677.1 hypothetical protein KDW03_09330 [Thermospira aquatica]
MRIALRYLENERVECSYKGVHLALWDVLKYTLHHPYLKHYFITDYEGGNTLVPREAWRYEENLVYKELAPGVFYFPYESLGFVLNDSLSSLSLYAFEESFTGIPDTHNADLAIEIRHTDEIRLVFHRSFLPLFLGFYTLSVLKIGFEDVTVTHLGDVLTSLVEKERPLAWEPVTGSVTISPKGLQFLVETEEKGSEVYYRFTYKSKCKKERLKPNEVKSLVLTFKKKILVTWEDKAFFLAGLLLILWLILLLVKKKFLMPLLFFVLVLFVGWLLLKRFYLIFFVKKISS